jgi:hypothetical protein
MHGIQLFLNCNLQVQIKNYQISVFSAFTKFYSKFLENFKKSRVFNKQISSSFFEQAKVQFKKYQNFNRYKNVMKYKKDHAQ